MAGRSKVVMLPAEVKAWLDGSLVEGNFSGYEALEEALRARGYEVSKSSIHRYGQDFEGRLKALRLVTEQARAVVEHSPDDEDAVNQALVRLTQEKLFNLVMEVKVDPEKVDLSKLTRSISDLSRASITVKRFASETRAKLSAKLTALEAQAGDGKSGLSLETLRRVREEIYGIV